MPKKVLLLMSGMLVMCLLLLSTKVEAKRPNVIDSITVYMANSTMECGTKNTMDIRVKNFKNVTNFQFSIHFNENRITGNGIKNFNPKFPSFSYNSTLLPNGDVAFSWSGAATTMADDELLFSIELTPYNFGTTSNGQYPITFLSSPTPIQAYTSASTSVKAPVKAISAVIQIVDKTAPRAICPNSQFYKGLDSVIVASILGTAIDECGSAMITTHNLTGAVTRISPNDANGRYFPLGVTNVIYNARDLAGNTSQCPFKIVLVKNSDDTLTYIIGSSLTRCEIGADIDVGIFIGNANGKNINDMNFSLTWDKDAFTYLSTNTLDPMLASAGFNTSAAANGQLGFTWSGTPANITDNMRLFNIRFRAVGKAGKSALRFGSLPVAISATSQSLGNLPVRYVPGDLFIRDYTPPIIKCQNDTLIYAVPTSATNHPVLGSVIKPYITENCDIETIQYTLSGATNAVNQLLNDNNPVNFNFGTTNVLYRVTDYGANVATCSQVIKVNKLTFSVSSDSVPCATKNTTINVRADDFENLKALQFDLRWNPSQLTLNPTDIIWGDAAFKNNTIVTGTAASGQLSFNFNMPSGQALTFINASNILRLPFALTGKVDSPIEFLYGDAKTLRNNVSIKALVKNGSVKNFDTQAPAFANCPADITTTLSSTSTCKLPVTWTAPTVSDNCDATISTSVKITKQQGNVFPANTPSFSGDEFSVGTTIVYYTATDAHGNSNTCSFKVIVRKNTPPQINCPADVTLSTTTADCNVTYTLPTPTTSDPCVQNAVTVTNDAGSNIFPIGTKVVTFKATDDYGNTATCAMRVTVVDKFAPKITCPANITKPADTDKDGTNITWAAPVVEEACSSPILLTPLIAPNGFYKIGKTTVTYTVTDNKANSASCSFEITVTDTQNPKVNCPPNGEINVNAVPNTCEQVVPVPTFTDNSGKVPTIIASTNLSPTNTYPVGKTVVTFTVRDSSGNVTTCNYTVNVKDVIKPTFSAVPNVTVNTNPNVCTATLPGTATPIVSDACSNTTINITRIPAGNDFPIGTSTIIFTATDESGNSATTSMTITVKDVNVPTINGKPNDITANAEVNKNGATVSWTPPTAQGVCNNNVVLTSTHKPGDFFPVGSTIVTYTATDTRGNSTTITFTVNVIDNQAPKINCPPNSEIKVDANPTTCGQTVPLPIFSDNSGQPATIIASTNVAPDNFYPIGKTQVSFTVSDVANNTAVCAFVIHVKDVTKPTFTNVKDLTVNTNPSVCMGKINPSDMPTATDGCGNTTWTVKSIPDASGDFPIGVSTVVFTVTDQDNNSGTASIKVTVVDREAPTLNDCPNKIMKSTDPNKDGATITWTPPTAKDNCTVTLGSSHQPNTFFKLGTTIVTYTATDASGNTATCTFEVEVTDNEKPVIDCKNIVVNNDPGKCGATIIPPTAKDNIKIDNVIFSPSLPADNYFEVGAEQSFMMIAIDQAGNTATCSFTVKVNDKEAPKVTDCPKDVTINAPVGQCTATLNPLPTPTFTDNCSGTTLSIVNNRDNLPNGTDFRVGEPNIVVYTATDAAGNSASCSYRVIVNSDIKPSLICPTNINLTLQTERCDTIVNWAAPLATAGCNPLVGTPVADIQSGSVIASGITKVTYKIKDTNNNETTCSFNITVRETTKPTFDAFPTDIELTANETDCSATHTWIAPKISDKCGAQADVSLVKISGPTTGDKLNIGTFTVVYRATDKAGNTAEKSFKITVKDKGVPKITDCPKSDMKVNIAGAKIVDTDNAILDVKPEAGCKEVILTFKPFTIAENCSLPYKIAESTTAKFALGAKTPYTFTVTDAAGNKSECKVNVEVLNIEAPVISLSKTGIACDKESVQLLADSLLNTVYSWTGPNGFVSSAAKPKITNLGAINIGQYSLKVTQNGCVSAASKAVLLDVAVAPDKAKDDNYSVYSEDELTEVVIVNDELRAGLKPLVRIKDNVKNGTLKMRDDGEFTYVSNKNFIGIDDFTYTVAYENCPDAASRTVAARIEVKIKEAKVPNIITPNDDGTNDVMIIDYPFTGKENASLCIFNEWGHELYRVEPYDNTKAWKATFNDKPVPDGTYYFIFKPDTEKPAQKGFITVIR